MRAVLGPAGGTLIAAGIAVSTFGFLNLVILVTPRVFQAMAADGVFFPRLARLHPVHRTPTAAIVLQAVLGLAPWRCRAASASWWTTSPSPTGCSSGSRSRGCSSIARGIGRPAWSRRRERSAHRAIRGRRRCSWRPSIFVVASSIAANPRNALIGTGLLALGVPVYWYWSRAGKAVVTPPGPSSREPPAPAP